MALRRLFSASLALFGLCFGAKAERRVTAIATGDTHNLVLVSDGTVWAWGANNRGQSGDGTRISSQTPVLVSGLLAELWG